METKWNRSIYLNALTSFELIGWVYHFTIILGFSGLFTISFVMLRAKVHVQGVDIPYERGVMKVIV